IKYLSQISNSREERAEHGHVRARRGLAPQIGIDDSPARIHREDVSKVVGRVENGPGRLAKSVLVLAHQRHGRSLVTLLGDHETSQQALRTESRCTEDLKGAATPGLSNAVC